jgi:hypothetical protein
MFDSLTNEYKLTAVKTVLKGLLSQINFELL